MNIICPNCQKLMDARWVNIERNIAKCENCNSMFEADQLLQGEVSELQGQQGQDYTPVVQESQELDLRPPSGSKISIEAFDQNNLRIKNERGGFQFMTIFLTMFTTFWLGFVAFWTFMASQGSFLFALFSIPFWFVGFGLAGGVIRSVAGRDTIEFLENEIRIIRWGVLKNKEFLIPYDEVNNISMSNWSKSEKVNKNPFSSFSFIGASKNAPGISYGMKKEYFFSNLSKPDMEWIIKVMNQVLKNRKDGRAYFG